MIHPKMIVTFIKAVYFFMKRGGERVANSERNTRIRLCNGCEYLAFARCTHCGCWVQLKTYLIDEHCPINKWHKGDSNG